MLTQETIGVVLMGFLAGLICSLGGALKDAPYEGFKPRTFPRSIIVGTIGGFVTIWATHQLHGIEKYLVAFCLSGYFERACVEGWKIVRGSKPGKHSYRNVKKMTFPEYMKSITPEISTSITGCPICHQFVEQCCHLSSGVFDPTKVEAIVSNIHNYMGEHYPDQVIYLYKKYKEVKESK